MNKSLVDVFVPNQMVLQPFFVTVTFRKIKFKIALVS